VGEQAGEVVVEAELLLGGGQGLVVDVELRCPLDDRVAPGDEDGLLVTGGTVTLSSSFGATASNCRPRSDTGPVVPEDPRRDDPNAEEPEDWAAADGARDAIAAPPPTVRTVRLPALRAARRETRSPK